jgi:hypothetical protein
MLRVLIPSNRGTILSNQLLVIQHQSLGCVQTHNPAFWCWILVQILVMWDTVWHPNIVMIRWKMVMIRSVTLAIKTTSQLSESQLWPCHCSTNSNHNWNNPTSLTQTWKTTSLTTVTWNFIVHLYLQSLVWTYTTGWSMPSEGDEPWWVGTAHIPASTGMDFKFQRVRRDAPVLVPLQTCSFCVHLQFPYHHTVLTLNMSCCCTCCCCCKCTGELCTPKPHSGGKLEDGDLGV